MAMAMLVLVVVVMIVVMMMVLLMVAMVVVVMRVVVVLGTPGVDEKNAYAISALRAVFAVMTLVVSRRNNSFSDMVGLHLFTHALPSSLRLFATYMSALNSLNINAHVPRFSER